MGAHAAAPSILKMVTTPKTVPTLQMEGVVALASCAAEGAIDVLLELASASWPTLRSAALVAIARIDSETFISVLAGLDPDPHWSVRAALAGALAELPGKLGEARLTTLTDDDQRVIPAVYRAVAALNTANAKTTLVERLRSEDPGGAHGGSQRPRAIKASDRRPPWLPRSGGPPHRTTPTWRARRSSPRWRRSIALPQSLGLCSAQLALTLSWAIRLRAAELLRGIDGAAAPPTRRPPGRRRRWRPSCRRFRQLMAPVPTRRMAYIDTENGSIQIELAVVDAPRTVAKLHRAGTERLLRRPSRGHRVVATS